MQESLSYPESEDVFSLAYCSTNVRGGETDNLAVKEKMLLPNTPKLLYLHVVYCVFTPSKKEIETEWFKSIIS